MALNSSWVEAILARLTVRYGASFMRQYADLDAQLVKDDWADVLDGARPELIRYAFDNLPADKPVNAMQFRNLVRNGPAPEVPQLPPAPADPQRVAEAVAQIAVMATEKAPRAAVSPAQQCIDSIERVVGKRDGIISSEQKHMVAHCLRMPNTSTRLPVEVAP
jgi:hypothetical protein